MKIRKSPKYNLELKEVCQEKDIKCLRPLAANQTRWNSVVMSLKSLVPMKSAFDSLGDRTSELDWTRLILDQTEWKIVEAIITVLKMPQLITKLWEADTKPTVHLVVKELYNLENNLLKLSKDRDSYVNNLSEILLREVKRRFRCFGAEEKVPAVAHYLDPATHGIVLEEVDLMESTKANIKLRSRQMKKPNKIGLSYLNGLQ